MHHSLVGMVTASVSCSCFNACFVVVPLFTTYPESSCIVSVNKVLHASAYRMHTACTKTHVVSLCFRSMLQYVDLCIGMMLLHPLQVHVCRVFVGSNTVGSSIVSCFIAVQRPNATVILILFLVCTSFMIIAYLWHTNSVALLQVPKVGAWRA